MTEKKPKKSAPTGGNKRNIVKTVHELVDSAIEKLGYEVWNIEYFREPTEWILEITIETKTAKSISIYDCEKVHRKIEVIIDAADPIENSYSLQVSSPGLDRELKHDFHFDRYKGKKVNIRLFARSETIGAKAFEAVLDGTDGGSISFYIGETLHTMKRGEVASVHAIDELAPTETDCGAEDDGESGDTDGIN